MRSPLILYPWPFAPNASINLSVRMALFAVHSCSLPKHPVSLWKMAQVINIETIPSPFDAPHLVGERMGQPLSIRNRAHPVAFASASPKSRSGHRHNRINHAPMCVARNGVALIGQFASLAHH